MEVQKKENENQRSEVRLSVSTSTCLTAVCAPPGNLRDTDPPGLSGHSGLRAQGGGIYDGEEH